MDAISKQSNKKDRYIASYSSLGDNVDVMLNVIEVPTMTKEWNPPFLPYNWSELSPYVFRFNGERRALVSNSRSTIYRLREGKTVFDEDAYIEDSVRFAAWPLCLDIADNKYIAPEKMPNGGFWKYVYYNAFGLYRYGNNIYSVLHGENKNCVGDGYSYCNTVKSKDVQYNESEYTSTKNGENWANYFAFISMSRSTVTTVKETGSLIEEEYGPIVWPVRPYLDNNSRKQSSGVRHPSYIIKDGYLYVFYVDNHADYQESIHCARARLDKNGRPSEFYKLYNGEFSEKALPDNFDINDRSIFYKAGGRGDAVLSSKKSIRFYPAKLKETDYYIGLLEETINGLTHQLKLYISKDLKTWTNELIVPDSVRENWKNALMHYPMINDSEFCAGTEVDPNDFTIVGTTFVNGINGGWPTPQYMRFSIEINEKKDFFL